VSSPTISVILVIRDAPERLWPTLRSIRAQSVAAEVIVVVASDQRHAAHAVAREVDTFVELRGTDWTPGRALNTGADACHSPVHATVLAGRELPRADWLERVLAHHHRTDVAGVSGARFDRERRILLEPRDVRATDWGPSWGFSTVAAGWRASSWVRWPFPEAVPAAEDRIWAWSVVRSGAVLVVDPFLQLEGPPAFRPRAWSIFRRTADEWASLLSAGTPVTAPSLGQAVDAWWRYVDSGVAAPAALQRLNYFRLARELGRWAGGRRAGRASRGPERALHTDG
jgi:glycosyl transferase family 2